MTPDAAEILSLHALGWLAGDPAALERFLAVSGIDAQGLKAGAGSRDMALAVIDFLLLHEAFLLPFCESAEIRPPSLHLARHVLETARP